MNAHGSPQMDDGPRLLICGFGELGRAVAASARNEQNVQIVECNPVRAAKARSLMFDVLEADVADPIVIAGIRATDIAICIQDPIGLQLVRQFKRVLPNSRIGAACRNWSIAEEYLKAGASQVTVPSWLAGQGLAASVPG